MLTAKAISDLRCSLELTQEEFAKKIGVTRVTVARWESGERVPAKEYENPLMELRHEDFWPTKDFFIDVLGPLANNCGSSKVRKIRKQNGVSKRAVLDVAETLISSTGTHPQRYLDLSEFGDRAAYLLEAIYEDNVLEDHELEKHVKALFSGYRPQAL